MSKRRWRGRAATLVVSSDEEEEEEKEAERRREKQQQQQQQQQGKQEGEAEPVPPRATRRAGLQLSQSTAGGSRGGAASNALAVLLAGSRAAAVANGASGGASGRASAAAAAAGTGGAAAAKSYPRRGSRAMAAAQQQQAGAAVLSGGPSQQGTACLPGAAAAAAAAARAVKAGAGRGELWVERYAPASEAELVVHKKKVQEVRDWLEGQRRSLGQPGVPRLLVVTGPPGCGKSAVLTALARSLGFDVNEWRPPNAVQREEADYAGMQRRSKLDDFGEFVVRAKMPHLSLSSSGGSGGSGSSGGSGPPSSAAAASQQQQAAMQATQQAAAAGLGRPQGRLPPSLLPTLVVVDDLPHAPGPEQRRQIADALGDLAAGARFPVVVVATETSGKAQQEKGLSAASGSFQGLHKELIAVLEARQATTVSFNPFTSINIAKVLRGILERERRALPEADVQAIAEQSNGDMFNAISTLQFVCTGVAAAATPAAGPRGGKGRGTKRKAAAAGGGGAGGTAKAGGGGGGKSRVGFALRDSTLTLFHALGKLLYNKRLEGPPASGASARPSQQPSSGAQPPCSQQQQQQQAGRPSSSDPQPWFTSGFWQAAAAEAAETAVALPLAPWARRKPMEFDPEAVLAGAGLEAGSVAAFLHENLLHFVDDSAVEDAASCLDQLSAADCLASGRRWGTGDAMMGDEDSPSSTLLDALAASTAARGVCFANAHPAPRRWLPLKAPTVFAAARGLASNREELSRRCAATWATAGGLGSLEPAGRLAAELLPYARAIAARCHNPPALQRLQPERWWRFWQGQLYEPQQRGSRGGGGGWQEEQEDGAGTAVGVAGGSGEAGAVQEDAIEESEDEDDW